MRIEVSEIASPIGPLAVAFDEAGKLRALELPSGRRSGRARLEARFSARSVPAPPAAIARPFARYFAGDLDALDGIGIAPEGGAFFQKVWTVLRRVKPGQTVSYKELARRAGKPNAVRASASANARNPIAIVVPCHRVIGSDGHLCGYGGGLPMKQWLLRHEGVKVDDRLHVVDGAPAGPRTASPGRRVASARS
jgi:methylated-DNA-[protein]-cysteine S-methyltransferase